ncbi:MAG: 2-C-methyl-D-erythritol 2,4-cyclodiphosphate synthase [Bacteroidales bacterium]|nr:2-C-methyl-D-erythritol 2,4-cyclodiphosphate synthase [Bacteroidales bacterium]
MNLAIRIGHGYDVHRLQDGLPMYLCGIRIDSPRGFVAHSDGDVAIHALCDAMLGALALRDIGYHFPDQGDTWKGADSKRLLSLTYDLVRKAGWTLGNADITIILQVPKIAPLVPRMQACLAEILGVAADSISVKATTTERLGFAGREEGCEVHAVVLLVRAGEIS